MMFYYKTGEYPWEINQLIDNNGVLSYDYDREHNYESYETEASIDKGVTYRFIPCVGFDFINGSPDVWFHTEIPEHTYSINNESIAPVTLKNYEGTSLPYRITKNKIHGLLDITVQISENQQIDYDEIVLFVKDNALLIGQYNEAGDTLGGYEEGNKCESFKRDTKTGKINTECTISGVMELMFSSSTDIFVYGIKNGVWSSGTKKTIDCFDESDLDYDNLVYGMDSYTTSIKDFFIDNITVNCDTVSFLFSDNETGVSTDLSCVIEGDDILKRYGNQITNEILTSIENSGRLVCKASLPDEDNIKEGKIEFPHWMYTDTGFTCYIYDNAGNVKTYSQEADNSWSYRIVKMEKIQPEAGGQIQEPYINVVKEVVSEKSSWPDKVLLYSWNTSTQKWDYVNQRAYNNNSNWLLKSELNYGDNKFIKVIFQRNASQMYDIPSAPAYIYTGNSNTGNKDYIYPVFMGSNGATVAICSDAPVFARTVVTNKAYEECKNWSISEWEDRRKYIKEELLTFSNNEPTIYKIYDSESDIAGATCYAVIVHFADGTKAMSQIMQK